MTQPERVHKLHMIGALTREELKGWWLYVVTREMRAPFDGERAALLSRARALGVALEG